MNNTNNIDRHKCLEVIYDTGQGPSIDRYIVVIGTDAYLMSDNADKRGGVNMLVGDIKGFHLDFLPEKTRMIPLEKAPRGVQNAVSALLK